MSKEIVLKKVPEEYRDLLDIVAAYNEGDNLSDSDIESLLFFYEEKDGPNPLFSEDTLQNIKRVDEIVKLHHWLDGKQEQPAIKIVIMKTKVEVFYPNAMYDSFDYAFDFEAYGIKAESATRSIQLLGSTLTDKKVAVACNMFIEIFGITPDELEDYYYD